LLTSPYLGKSTLKEKCEHPVSRKNKGWLNFS